MKTLKKKLFISQPMNGLTPEEIESQRNRILEFVKEVVGKENFKYYTLLDTYFIGKNLVTPLDYLAESIKYLGKADLVVFGKGWQNARGCKVEHLVCEEYHITHIEEGKEYVVIK